MPGGWLIGSMVLGMTVAMLTPLLTFDFRGDIDRIDLLKALPLPAWRMALGQLLAPTLLLTAVQLLVIGLVQVLWGRRRAAAGRRRDVRAAVQLLVVRAGESDVSLVPGSADADDARRLSDDGPANADDGREVPRCCSW